jgi:hypothetical protein
MPRGLSLVCPRCDYKVYDQSKHWLPDLRHVIDLPSAFAWSSWTLTNVEQSGDNLVLSAGALSGTAVSPQMINLTRRTTRYWDCTRVKINWTHTLNDGKVRYYGSNDGGTGYRILKTEDAIFRLNQGDEASQFKQVKYNDLRIKVEITRNEASDTTPSVSRILVTHNKIRL